LDEVGTSLPRRDYFRWRQRAWQNGDLLFPREFDNLTIEPRSGQEARTCLYAFVRGVHIQNGPGSNHHFRMVLNEVRDQVNCSRHSHGDLDDWYPASRDRFSRKVCLFGGRHSNCRDDGYFLDESADFDFVHIFVSFPLLADNLTRHAVSSLGSLPAN